MQTRNYISAIFLAAIVAVFTGGCEKDYYETPPPPKTAHPTATLEAEYMATAPVSISSSYWKTAGYLQVNCADISTNQLYGDGLLNLTGTYAGKTDFNAGANPALTLKAAYDHDKIYILAEWYDSDVDLSDGSWLYNGPVDPLKADNTNGWTSQRNSDRISLNFEMDATKSDLWQWNMAHSAPLGYAEDKNVVSGIVSADAGQNLCVRNRAGLTDRSGPSYEWDGTSQNVTLANGQASILDPAFYLVNKTPFLGDVTRGDSIFHRSSAPGDCASCHGNRGEGGSATIINTISLNKKSRSVLMDNMDQVPDMGSYWGALSSTDKQDVVAFVRGLAGVPGYYLTPPNGSSADITAISNVTAIDIKNAMLASTNKHSKYQVLFIRKLNTGNADDIQFISPSGKTFKFGVSLMDNDELNKIGSTVETLTFK